MFGIVVLSYNHPQITERCLRSVLRFVPAQQVGVVHNGSQSKWVDGLRAQFPDIHHWVYQDNRGFSGGANRVFQMGFQLWPWVMMLTNDTELLAFHSDQWPEKPGLYVPRTFLRKLERVDFTMGGFDSRKAKLWHYSESPQPPQRAGAFHYAPGTAFLLHQDVYTKTGPFDESLHTYWEDVDFSVRAHRVGYPPTPTMFAQVLHAGGKTTRKDRFYTQHLFQRNRRLISKRYCPWWARPELYMRLLGESIFKRR